ncbi:MAG: M81 family metallopeptidase [Planctomycetaceae bacterium]
MTDRPGPGVRSVRTGLQGTTMRIGLIALLHESNTFSHQPTTLESFRQNLLLTGEPIRQALADAHHEVGGFFEGLEAAGAGSCSTVCARALPSGTIGFPGL